MNAHIPYCKCKNVDFIEPKDCLNCEQYHSKSKPTNADRIRSMSDEELARFLDNHGSLWGADIVSTADDWLDWLRGEATDG